MASALSMGLFVLEERKSKIGNALEYSLNQPRLVRLRHTEAY